MRLAAPSTRLLAWSLFLLSGPLSAGPVLHERFRADPVEDLRFGATTESGAMPLAVQTRSGVITAPDESQPVPFEPAEAYGGARTPNSADSSYYIDRLTTRPERVRYDEPFRPSILPFKRLYAFDALHNDLSFGVKSRALSNVPVGGLAEDTEDVFFADFPVDLVGGVPVRIPSVGPGARVRAMHTDPPSSVQILEDSAENWFAQSEHSGRVRMVLQLSLARQSFGSQFRPVSFAALAPYLPPLPGRAQQAAREIGAHIGVRPNDPPARVLMTLVDYFRRFHESAELPTSVDPVELYRELSFHQKGVCRHRAYAFAITALAFGLPTRLVYNEAHAWVEVYDTELWHRIDLGGAASNIEDTRADPLTPEHRPPPDPFTWPVNSDPTLALHRRAPGPPPLGSASPFEPAPGPDGSRSEPPASPGSANSSGVQPSADSGTGDVPAPPGGPPQTLDSAQWNESTALADIELHLKQEQLLRGRPLGVSGVVTRQGRPCPLARVDVYLSQGQHWKNIGSVATDRSGEFAGQVTLPQSTPVGSVQVAARVVGGCD